MCKVLADNTPGSSLNVVHFGNHTMCFKQHLSFLRPGFQAIISTEHQLGFQAIVSTRINHINL